LRFIVTVVFAFGIDLGTEQNVDSKQYLVTERSSLSTENNAFRRKGTASNICRLTLTVHPPAYTGKQPRRSQDKFTLNVEDGAP
jgi:hypothetical protein